MSGAVLAVSGAVQQNSTSQMDFTENGKCKSQGGKALQEFFYVQHCTVCSGRVQCVLRRGHLGQPPLMQASLSLTANRRTERLRRASEGAIVHIMLRTRLSTGPHGETLNCCNQGSPTHVAALWHPSVTINEAIIHRQQQIPQQHHPCARLCNNLRTHGQAMSVRVG